MNNISIRTPWVNAWHPRIVGTLVYIRRTGEVLLINKKRGHGAGKVNAPGGKLQPGETVVECARREVLEEVGLRVGDLHCRAELRFVEQSGDQWLGFVFVADEFNGELTETDEAQPFWCAEDAIPYASMWPSDKQWLPQVLAGADFLMANVLFDAGQLVDYELVDLKSFERELVEETSLWRSIRWEAIQS